MRIHNSLRNNFFGVFLFLVLLVPSVVGAVEVNKKITNYEKGSFYYNDGSNVRDNNSGDKNSPFLVNLWNIDQTKKILTEPEITALQQKIKESGSSFDIKKISVASMRSINTDNNSTFVYDPTPNDTTNNDDLIIAGATNKGHLLIPEVPVLEDQKNISLKSNDINTGNGFLNYMDKDQGLEPGTTVSNKNRINDLQQNQDLAQQKITDTAADRQKAYDDLQAFNASGSTNAVQKAMLEAKLAETTQNYNNASHNAYTNQRNLTNAQNAATASGQAPTTCGTPSAGGLITNYFNINCVVSLVSWITNIIFKFTSFIAYIAGTLFDYSLELSINSAQFFKKLGVIEVTWSFIRDILNMTFIFILLWTAVQILIGNDAKYNAKQVLTKVIIVAILINFSLFAAKLMVDGSNVVSLKIYEAMKQPSTESKDASISERIMNTVGLSTLYNITDIFTEDKTKVTSGCANNPGGLITISIMGSIFLIILTLALGLAAILFLVRLVNIIILFIKSPLWVWGYVLPGNSFVSKQKDEWWAQMMHVLTFPIVYLFWMLVAVIIFDSLGSAKTETGGLLALICNTPGTQNGGAGTMISLVAIFCIVIIFMMKAIEYGVSHAAGPKGSVGGAFSTKMANKFAGYQTAMTKGLAKKAGSLAMVPVGFAGRKTVDASVGAAKLPLRAFTGLAGAGRNLVKGDKGWQGFKDGFVDPTITTKNIVGDIARNQAINGGFVGNVTGLSKAAGKLAKKYEDPTNSRGETKKKADARRVSSAVEKEENRTSAIEKEYRTDTHEEWLKKNPRGTFDGYKAYAEKNTAEKIEKLYGKGISTLVSAKTGNSHIKDLMNNSIKETKNASGVVTGIKFSEYDLNNGIEDMLSDKNTKELIKEKKTKFELFADKRAEAKMKVLKNANESNGRKSGQKNRAEETKETLKKQTDRLREKVSKVVSEKDTEDAISTRTIYTGIGDNDDTIINLNKVMNKRHDIEYDIADGTLTGTAKDDAVSKSDKELERAREAHTEFADKQKSALIKKEREYNSHVEKIKKAEEDEKNK